MLSRKVLHNQSRDELNEIRTRTSVSQDGGNLVSRARVTLEQQSGKEDSGNEIRYGGTVEAWNEYFLSRVCVCVAPVHTCEMQTQVQMPAQGNEQFSTRVTRRSTMTRERGFLAI